MFRGRLVGFMFCFSPTISGRVAVVAITLTWEINLITPEISVIDLLDILRPMRSGHSQHSPTVDHFMIQIWLPDFEPYLHAAFLGRDGQSIDDISSFYPMVGARWAPPVV